MPPQAPWSPTAHAFAHHQFSHVANFWKQGCQASFCLEVLPGGQAELNLTFQLSPASEVVPPPSHVPPVPAPHRPIHPLFPESTSPKVASKRQRKNYQRSVLHRAALNAASSTFPPPKNGSLRQAASACAQRQQTDLVSTQSAKKRPLPNSPSHIPPLAQRIRKDIQIGESEAVEFEVFEFWCTKLAPPSQSPPVGEGDQIACSTTGSPLRGERVKLLAPPPPGRGSPPHGDPVVEQTCFLVGNN